MSRKPNTTPSKTIWERPRKRARKTFKALDHKSLYSPSPSREGRGGGIYEIPSTKNLPHPQQRFYKIHLVQLKSRKEYFMYSVQRWHKGCLAVLLACGVVFAGVGSSSAAKKKAKDSSQTVNLDLNSSVLNWTGKKVTGAHNGTIKLKSGQAVLSGNALVGGNFEVDMTSLQNDDIDNPGSKEKLVGHLKSDDFFSVEKFPTALFKITSVKALTPEKPGQPTHEITGDLTIKGITHPVTFPAVVSIKDGKAEATGSVVVDRTKWDVRYGSGKFFDNLGDKVIYDDFTVDLHLVGK
jgi:polyisoprenoid-binding protein YceI